MDSELLERLLASRWGLLGLGVGFALFVLGSKDDHDHEHTDELATASILKAMAVMRELEHNTELVTLETQLKEALFRIDTLELTIAEQTALALERVERLEREVQMKLAREEAQHGNE